jgi:peptide/nickel transport system substrate-binding protein
MRRRELLKAGVGLAAALAAPRIGGAAGGDTLVVARTGDLVVLDPVVTFNRPTRNYAYLVFDTLYGLDTSWQAQPQMVEGHELDDDGLTWLLHLRDGLRFHDNEPVLAKDVVASVRRFAVRVPFASALMAATDELSAADDRTVKFRLKRPFPHLPMALAGPGGTVPAIMPERLAATSPHQPVKEVVGSGPFRFLHDEHVSGARPPSRASSNTSHAAAARRASPPIPGHRLSLAPFSNGRRAPASLCQRGAALSCFRDRDADLQWD